MQGTKKGKVLVDVSSFPSTRSSPNHHNETTSKLECGIFYFHLNFFILLSLHSSILSRYAITPFFFHSTQFPVFTYRSLIIFHLVLRMKITTEKAKLKGKEKVITEPSEDITFSQSSLYIN
eukprot:TRINITY_DN3754_c0_g4_i2.p1 TRINITY_DN3754_c0_g4~~TRINITY_DN3754_c0_g4_i2.p1  ORF type:complete len:121 (+),score=20.10 TRINITY_DN3754_c0_g4_i2:228-590(+)